jgi:hypothetical protein
MVFAFRDRKVIESNSEWKQHSEPYAEKAGGGKTADRDFPRFPANCDERKFAVRIAR